MLKPASNIVSHKDSIPLRSAILFAREHLPTQGPLEYFVHHNTLHSLENYNFFDALKIARNLYHAKTNMDLSWYQRQLTQGRILSDDLRQSFERVFPKVDYNLIKENKLLFWNETYSSSKKSIAAKNFINSQVLKESNLENEFRKVSTFWDYIEDKNFVINLNEQSQKNLFKFFAAYFDKGVAYWQMEDRHLGILYCFDDYSSALFPSGPNKHLKNIISEIKELSLTKKIESILQQLCPNENYWGNYLFQALYQIKGWSALALTLETKELYNPTQIKVDFNEFILIILMSELANLRYSLARKKLIEFEIDFTKDKDYFKASYLSYVFENSAVNQKVPFEIQNFLSQINYDILLKIWFEAYEWHLIKKFNPYLNHNMTLEKSTESITKKLQVIVCIDDREESLRRHYEDISPSIETYGYAGHFGLNIHYKGLNDAHFRPLCPVSVTPQHYVWEEPIEGNDKNPTLGKLKHFFYHNSRMPLFGTITSLILAPFSLFLFLTSIILPKYSHKFENRFKNRAKTKLNFLSSGDRENKGYTYEELANTLLAMLQTIGLTKEFAEIIYVCGHGSESTNNPHKAAYDCGACGGGRGIPNARIMAMAGNDPNVREILNQKNINIPDSTTFIAGYHNTANDDLLIFDQEKYPKDSVLWLKKVNHKVAALDAKERTRKFEDVSLNLSTSASYKHVQNRIFDYAQARAEYGHSTNAICVVGDRNISKDLFLDRRAFLVSYDSKGDKDATVIDSLMGSIVPVCAGINLEYYFSYVDPEIFGSGNKQPHNITSLMGVMNGYKSDLRLGLPWQMVEIHEPMRILIYVQSELEIIKQSLEKNRGAFNLVYNQWVKLIVITPDQKFFIATENDFEEIEIPRDAKLNHSPTSSEFYQKKREVLNFALIKTGHE